MKELRKQVAEIEAWDRQQCLETWIKLTGRLPTARPSSQFLRRALIFEAQCKALGGHSNAVKRKLNARGAHSDSSVAPSTSALSQGTQLVREWNGRIYRVNVGQSGFEMDGRNFTSLSAVAKQITGAQWSGSRFFGLTVQAA